MSVFEKYLAIWVALCMVVGVILSQTVPGIGEAIDSWQIRGISIPMRTPISSLTRTLFRIRS